MEFSKPVSNGNRPLNVQLFGFGITQIGQGNTMHAKGTMSQRRSLIRALLSLISRDNEEIMSRGPHGPRHGVPRAGAT
jgi:hypothetical protein